MLIQIYCRNKSAEDTQIILNMMHSIGSDNFEICDIGSTEVKVFQHKEAIVLPLVIVLGGIVERYVRQCIPATYLFPAIEQLYPLPENKSYRQDAWKKLQEIQEILKTGIIKTVVPEWEYASTEWGNKKICIYRDLRPTNVSADLYISKAECELLIELKNAFGAKSIKLEEK